jgi:hypothetical protein
MPRGDFQRLHRSFWATFLALVLLAPAIQIAAGTKLLPAAKASTIKISGIIENPITDSTTLELQIYIEEWEDWDIKSAIDRTTESSYEFTVMTGERYRIVAFASLSGTPKSSHARVMSNEIVINSPDDVNDAVDVIFPEANVVGRFTHQGAGVSGFNMALTPAVGFTSAFLPNFASDTDGNFKAYVNPGNYKIKPMGAISHPNLTFGLADCTVVVSQVSTCNITSSVTNLSGTVTGKNGLAAETAVSISPYTENDGTDYRKLIKTYTNASGVFKASLQAGQYAIDVYPDYKTTGSLPAESLICDVAQSGESVCNVNLPPPNVVSTFQFNRPKTQDDVYSLGFDLNEWFHQWGSYSTDESVQNHNEFVMNFTESGMYRLRIQTVDSNLPGPLCDVDITKLVRCDVTINPPNFKFAVYENDQITTGVNPVLNLIETNRNLISPYYQQFKPGPAQYEMSLIDGSYTLAPKLTSNYAGKIYSFDVASGIVRNLKVIGSDTIIQPVNGVYRFDLGESSISGKLLKSVGNPIANANFWAEFTDPVTGNQEGGTVGRTDAEGRFSFGELVDGEYVIYFSFNSVKNRDPDYVEPEPVTVTVTNGVGERNLTITALAANLKGTVSGPDGILANLFMHTHKLDESSGKYSYFSDIGWRGIRTNATGNFSGYLPAGTYKFYIETMNSNSEGVAPGYSQPCTISEGVLTTCNISLAAGNVNGVFKLDGVDTGGSIRFIPVSNQTNVDTDFSVSKYSNLSTPFSLNIEPGQYIFATNVWSANGSKAVVGGNCLVPSTGNVTCNQNLTTNFRAQIYSASNTLLATDVYLNIRPINSRFSTHGSVGDSNSTYSAALSSRVYDLYVYTSDNSKGSNQLYKLEVNDEGVATVTSSDGVPAIRENGVFKLQLAPHRISGTVVAPDGTTVIPDAIVQLALQEGGGIGVSSGASGYFGFSGVPNGLHELYARPPLGSIQYSDSEVVSATVSNAQGPNNLVLRLQDVNVRGVVRGPGVNGVVSPGNIVQAERVDSSGNRASVNAALTNKKMGFPLTVFTNSQGSFAMKLAPGTYFLRSQSDLNYAKGNAAWSEQCVVPVTGIATCNITLTSSNFKFKVVKSGGTTAITNSYAGANFVFETKESYSDIANKRAEINTDGRTGNRESYLSDGKWQIYLEAPWNDSSATSTSYIATVSSGSITSVVDKDGNSISATSGIYTLTLPGVNLTGRIIAGSATYTSGASVTVMKYNPNWKGWQHFGNRWSSGEYGFKVEPGTYRVTVELGNGNNQEHANSYVENCVVPSSGSVTCNVTLQTPNLFGKITNSTGQIFRQAWAHLFIVTDDKSEGSRRFDQNIRLDEGYFSTRINDGDYLLSVNPWWEARLDNSPRDYSVKVANGVVTVSNSLTGSPLSATNNVYTFALGSTSLKGKVLGPGTSTTAIAWAQIQVAPAGGNIVWQYSTHSDQDGNFALNVPNGSYVIQAIPNSQGNSLGKSIRQNVTIANGTSSSLTLRLREANVFGRVVTPGSPSTPLANVGVNIFVDGEYAYAYTNESGVFGAFIENESPNCPTKCSLYLSIWNNADYTPKQYQLNTLGDLGDKAIGGSTTKLTALVPTTGSNTVPNKYGFISVETTTNNTDWSWVTGLSLNEIGMTGLPLDTGKKYRIRAFPGQDAVGKFSAKELIVDSFNPSTMANLSMTFDRPNIEFRVKDRLNNVNAYGWYMVQKKNISNAYVGIDKGSLDIFGKSSLLLQDGDYKVRFYPGKINGVETEISFTVSGGVASGSTITSGVSTVVLPAGNISGTIVDSENKGINGAIIGAYRNDDNSIRVSTESTVDGYFELNLDRTYAWTIKAYFATTGFTGTLNVATASPSNATLGNQTIRLNIAP